MPAWVIGIEDHTTAHSPRRACVDSVCSACPP